MKSIGYGAMLVALIMMIIGVTQGLGEGNHSAAITAFVFAFGALAVGIFFTRE